MPTTPRYLIVDDEPRLAVAWPQAECLGLWHDGLSAREAIASQRPDVAFLDIRMPGMDGLLLAQHQLGQADAPLIVFVTAYQEHALEAFGVAAVDYLCKPVDPLRLAATVQRLQGLLAARTASAPGISVDGGAGPLRYLRAGQGDTVHLVPVEQVMYLEAADKYVRAVTENAEHWLRSSLKTLASQLDSDDFWPIHRSLLVNVR